MSKNIDRSLPNNIDAEIGVLGSILIDPEVIGNVCSILHPDHFYRDAHRTIYQTMLSLHEKHEPTDYLLVSDELERLGKLNDIGGIMYILDLIKGVPTSGNALYYAQKIEKKARFRAVISECGNLVGMAYEEDEAVFSSAQERFFQIGQGNVGNKVNDHVTSLNNYWEQLQELHEQNQKGVITGVPTGFKLLNTLLGGFRHSKLYIVAARPGDGKTALALNFTYEAIRKGCQVLFFSIEMDEGELMQRLVAIESKVDAMHLRDARFEPDEWERIVNGIEQLQNYPGKLWTDDTPANDIDSMRSKARDEHAKHGVDMIIVDYLQLAQAGKTKDNKMESRRIEVEKVSRQLKEMSRELKVPVIALAQLNRDVESRANRVPQLSDLREAGGIEQDCDVAMFIYRDPVIPKEAPEFDVSLLIEKHRNGPKGSVPLHFVGSQTRFYPMEIKHAEE